MGRSVGLVNLWLCCACGRTHFDPLSTNDGGGSGSATIDAVAREPGMLGRWRFDDATGTQATDSSGNSYAGTFTDHGGGLPSWTTGRIGPGALSVAGDSSVLVADPGVDSNLDFTLGDTITIAAWIRPQPFNVAWGAILNKGTYGLHDTNYSFFQGNQAGSGPADLSFVITSGAGNYNNMGTDQNVLVEGIWQHVAVTFTFGNAASAMFYVNGVSYPGSTNFGDLNQMPTQNEAPLILGDTNQPEPFTFTGNIDDLRLYNRILSAAEISALYGACSDGDC